MCTSRDVPAQLRSGSRQERNTTVGAPRFALRDPPDPPTPSTNWLQHARLAIMGFSVLVWMRDSTVPRRRHRASQAPVKFTLQRSMCGVFERRCSRNISSSPRNSSTPTPCLQLRQIQGYDCLLVHVRSPVGIGSANQAHLPRHQSIASSSKTALVPWKPQAMYRFLRIGL